MSDFARVQVCGRVLWRCYNSVEIIVGSFWRTDWGLSGAVVDGCIFEYLVVVYFDLLAGSLLVRSGGLREDQLERCEVGRFATVVYERVFVLRSFGD